MRTICEFAVRSRLASALLCLWIVWGSAQGIAPEGLHSVPTLLSSIQQEPGSSNIEVAVGLLISAGVPRENICRRNPADVGGGILGSFEDRGDDSSSWTLPLCSDAGTAKASTPTYSPSNTGTTKWVRSRRQRYLAEEEEFTGTRDKWFYITHASCAFLCVITAALAAGLTMGLLSLDPLLLLIKVRAGATQEEKDQASALLPIVKKHHLLLVTLLLLNSMANEALPLFLEVLVSPLVAVILSVTLVLFFGEIIPSAIFTGPNKVALAYRMVPLVKLVMALLWPIAYPIASLLDHVLHDESSESTDVFGRGELSALVRIQYEERMSHKKRIKAEKAAVALTERQENSDIVNNLGALDFASTQAIKASKKTVERRNTSNSTRSSNTSTMISANTNPSPSRRASDGNDPVLTPDMQKSDSIHVDEVSMVEGALSMKTKVALDVYTPLHRMVSISKDMLLSERNMVTLYASGFSRIPVFQPNPQKPKNHTAIVGLLMTKQLIVVNPTEARPLSTLPLSQPRCVSPKSNLVDLLNLFQSGKLGHLALVCARPGKGQEALDRGDPLPEAAGLMGIITLEDVLEALLQEQIYDESDKYEREALRLSRWVAQKWRAHVRRKKRERSATNAIRSLSMGAVVEEAMEANERSSLIGGGAGSSNNAGFVSPIESMKQFFDNLSG